jgi:hypothetical protein
VERTAIPAAISASRATPAESELGVRVMVALILGWALEPLEVDPGQALG